MKTKTSLLCILFLFIFDFSFFAEPAYNLLINPDFSFHSFTGHREGKAESFSAHTVAFWRHDDYADITVKRESHIDPKLLPPYSVPNVVSIAPGKRFYQMITLPEAKLIPGEKISLCAEGWQSEENALQVKIILLKLDSEDGKWSPEEFGAKDKRVFAKWSRGELVNAKEKSNSVKEKGFVKLEIDSFKIDGQFTPGGESFSSDCNSIAIQVEFSNTSENAEVLLWQACLAKGESRAKKDLAAMRKMEQYSRHLPRTIQKLWKGEALHILVMGSSIDRASANPPIYLYDEDHNSPTFKQLLSTERDFDGALIGRADLDDYYGWWQHYFSYAGRLRTELMRRYNLPVEKICLNFMACDGSSIGEAHSGLEKYCNLEFPPGAGTNGYKAGKSWQELHPELFSRREGPGPDLVIFGSGANEKTDTPDEIAVFEGAIRWMQKNYPNVEFLFCMFQNQGRYTPNDVDLQALALRYQIPFLDYGELGDLITRNCNPINYVPIGHPQAAGHGIWFHVISKAFECWNPIESGQKQLYLPERVHKNTINWEGNMKTYNAAERVNKGNMFILDEAAFNIWFTGKGTSPVEVLINGVQGKGLRHNSNYSVRDIRNSSYRWGRGTLGERHVVEILKEELKIHYIDMKQIPERRFFSIDNQQWNCDNEISDFVSEWGNPFGNKKALLEPGQKAAIWLLGTDFSIAYLDEENAGQLSVKVDGIEKLSIACNEAYTAQDGQKYYMENRKAIGPMPYGMHLVEITALEKAVAILGIYSYDARSNRNNEREVRGLASPGETVSFETPFKAKPFVFTTNGLKVNLQSLSPSKASFTGTENGSFIAIGE